MLRQAGLMVLGAMALGALVMAPGVVAQPGAPLPGMMPGGVVLPQEMGRCCDEFQVGHWVEYLLERHERGGRVHLRMAVVGQEGPEQWWIEMTLGDPRRGEATCKVLMDQGAAEGSDRLKRLIVQPAGHLPLELPLELASDHVPELEDSEGEGVLVATERVKVRAGVFEARHYRRGEGAEVRDVWLSSKVAIWGVVRFRSRRVSLSLVAQGTGAVSRITGEPVLFDPSSLRR